MSVAAVRQLDRIGAAAGWFAVALLVSLFTVFPAFPEPDEPVAHIVRSATDDRGALLLGAYVGTLLGMSLIVFGACVAAALRRAERADAGWWILALAGVVASAVGIVGNASNVTLVRAVGHGARGDALWLGYGIDHQLGLLVGVPLAVFLFGIGMGARATGLLPSWLSATALVSAACLLLGAASVTGDEVDGGVLGIPILLGYVLLIVWVVATGVVLWRGREGRAGAAIEAAA